MNQTNNPLLHLNGFSSFDLKEYTVFFICFSQKPNDLRPAIADALCFLLLHQRTLSRASFAHLSQESASC